MPEQRRSSAGEWVDVGVDVPKDTETVPGVCPPQIGQTAPVQAEPAGLAASVPRGGPGATRSAVDEAGCAAFGLHRVRPQAGRSPKVVQPASLAVAANAKGKPERRAAQTRASALADGRWRGLAVPTAAADLARLLPRTRAQRGRTPRPHGPPEQSPAAPVGADRPVQAAPAQSPVLPGVCPVGAASRAARASDVVGCAVALGPTPAPRAAPPAPGPSPSAAGERPRGAARPGAGRGRRTALSDRTGRHDPLGPGAGAVPRHGAAAPRVCVGGLRAARSAEPPRRQACPSRARRHRLARAAP
jgi:hypothetical protein